MGGEVLCGGLVVWEGRVGGMVCVGVGWCGGFVPGGDNSNNKHHQHPNDKFTFSTNQLIFIMPPLLHNQQ